jgi:hypothetical protein
MKKEVRPPKRKCFDLSRYIFEENCRFCSGNKLMVNSLSIEVILYYLLIYRIFKVMPIRPARIVFLNLIYSVSQKSLSLAWIRPDIMMSTNFHNIG